MDAQDWEKIFFREVSDILDCVDINFETNWYSSMILGNALEIIILKHAHSCSASLMTEALKGVIARLVKKYSFSHEVILEGIIIATHYQVMIMPRM